MFQRHLWRHTVNQKYKTTINTCGLSFTMFVPSFVSFGIYNHLCVFNEPCGRKNIHFWPSWVKGRWCSWPVSSVQVLLDGFQSKVRFGSDKWLLKSDGRRKGVNHNWVNVVLNRISRCIGGDRFGWQEVNSIFDASLVNNAWAVVLKP